MFHSVLIYMVCLWGVECDRGYVWVVVSVSIQIGYGLYVVVLVSVTIQCGRVGWYVCVVGDDVRVLLVVVRMRMMLDLLMGGLPWLAVMLSGVQTSNCLVDWWLSVLVLVWLPCCHTLCVYSWHVCCRRACCRPALFAWALVMVAFLAAIGHG